MTNNKKYNPLQYLDEKYFSDKLYYLLNNKKEYFEKFKDLFVKKVYDLEKDYNLKNSVVIREYPLSIKKEKKSHYTGFIDLLFLDLDKDDDVVIGVENKFLTENSKGQLEDYKKSLESLYKDYSVKIIYLTLDGRYPKDKEDCDGFICLSWSRDILKMLLRLIIIPDVEKLEVDTIIDNYWSKRKRKKKIDKDIYELIQILIAIYRFTKNSNNSKNENDNADSNIIENYIKEILSLNKSKIREFSVKFSGTYYSLKYDPTKIKMFIPVILKYDQARHMIHQFVLAIINSKHKDITTIDTALSGYDTTGLKECFKIKESRIEDNIVKYLRFTKK